MNCAPGLVGRKLGLEQAGFEHKGARVEYEPKFAATLTLNRTGVEGLRPGPARLGGRIGAPLQGCRSRRGGPAVPPFSKAGKQLGDQDERYLFTAALKVIGTIKPKAVLIENVRGFLDAVFEDYRTHLRKQL